MRSVSSYRKMASGCGGGVPAWAMAWPFNPSSRSRTSSSRGAGSIIKVNGAMSRPWIPVAVSRVSATASPPHCSGQSNGQIASGNLCPLACRDPLNDPGLVALFAFDLESFGDDELKWTAEHVLALQAHCHLLDQPLDIVPQSGRG